MAAAAARKTPSWLLNGVLPIEMANVPSEVIAGCTLAALAIPEVMGYTKIAGMPVDHGPLHDPPAGPRVRAVRVVAPPRRRGGLGARRRSSRPGSSRLAPPGLDRVRRARRSLSALMCARPAHRGPHPPARVHRQLPVPERAHRLPHRRRHPGRDGPVRRHVRGQRRQRHDPREVRQHAPGDRRRDNVSRRSRVSIAVLGHDHRPRQVNKKIPGALIAVVGAIVLSYVLDLSARASPTSGTVQGGLPTIGLPPAVITQRQHRRAPADRPLDRSSSSSPRARRRRGPTRSSTATASRRTSTSSASALANVGAGDVGHVRRQRQPDQDVDGRQRRRQEPDRAADDRAWSSYRPAVPDGPLSYMPNAVLASVVFLIGIRLIDFKGMSEILPPARRTSSPSPPITAAIVVVVGVEQGIVLAIIASIVEHIDHSYHPYDRLVSIAHRRQGHPAYTSDRSADPGGPRPRRLPVRRQPLLRRTRPGSRRRSLEILEPARSAAPVVLPVGLGHRRRRLLRCRRHPGGRRRGSQARHHVRRHRGERCGPP